MRFGRSRGVEKAFAAMAGGVGAILALIAFVSRSDFVQRGCHHFSSDEWVFTANCTGAYNVGKFAGVGAVVSLSVTAWTLWSLSDV